MWHHLPERTCFQSVRNRACHRHLRSVLKPYLCYPDGPTLSSTDLLPIRTGHCLVIPKHHCARLSELPEDYAGYLGQAVSKVAKALTQGTSCQVHKGGARALKDNLWATTALDNTALNVVCNQEYAQVGPSACTSKCATDSSILLK